MRDKTDMNQMTNTSRRRGDDGLGPTSDIGSRLRALYGAVQEENIPPKLLDLLEQLDAAEKAGSTTKTTENEG